MGYTAPKPYAPFSLQGERTRAAYRTKVAPPPEPPRPVLGDKILVIPHIGEHKCEPAVGEIVFVHPTHNWYRVRFANGLHECYSWGWKE